MFVFGLLAFALASAGCAAATSIGWLVFAGALQGAASAILVPIAMTLLGSAATPLQRPRAMGMFSSLTGLAVLSGPVIGGLPVDSLGWRWAFWINVPLCVATAFLAGLRIPSNDRLVSKVGWPGVILLTVAMTAIVWGLSEGNAAGWSSAGAGWRMMPWTVSLFVVAPIGGILVGRLGERLSAVTGLLLQSAALTWMSLLCSSASSYGAWVPPWMLAGVGISLAMPAVQSAVLGSVAPRDMGKASGIYNTMRQLGWACGAAAAVAVFSASGSLATAQTLRNGYAAVLPLTAALSITGALLSLKLPSAVRANVRPAVAPAVSSPE